MKTDDITDAYYHIGGVNRERKPQTPILEDIPAFLIRCKVCNKGLCKLMVIAKSPRSKQNYVWVEPCPRCLAAARAGIDVEALELNADWQSRKHDETQESIDKMILEKKNEKAKRKRPES